MSKKQQLLDAAITLFSEQGFWNTPTAQISRHAGVSTGTLFNYFETKDALIDAVYIELGRELTRHIAADYPTDETIKVRSLHAWRRYVEWGVSHPARYRLLEQLRLSNLVSKDAFMRSKAETAFATTLIDEGQAAGMFSDISAEFMTEIALSLLEATVRLAFDLDPQAIDAHVETTFRMFWLGIQR